MLETLTTKPDHAPVVPAALAARHRESPANFPPRLPHFAALRADSGRALSAATRVALKAAGGLKVGAAATGLSTTHLSRCACQHHSDSLTLRDAVAIDAHGLARKGRAVLLATQAKLLGFVLVALPAAAEDGDGLMRSVLELTQELGDVAAAVGAGVRDGQVDSDEARAVLEQLDDLDRASAELRLKLRKLIESQGAVGTAADDS